jgi:hypothetical protein
MITSSLETKIIPNIVTILSQIGSYIIPQGYVDTQAAREKI